MKKILLASTALVLSAGIASAQNVAITGEGRMGVEYNSWGFGGSNYRQEQRLTLNFAATVQADHGLTFGVWTRARMSTGGLGTAGANGFSGSRVFVESNGFRLTFGNTDGAIRGAGAAMGYAGGCAVGYEGGLTCGDTAGLVGASQGQNSTGTLGVARTRIDYSFGSTRVALSYDRETRHTEFGIRTTFNAFTVALGYGRVTNTNFASGAGAITIGTPIAGLVVRFGNFNVLSLSGQYNGGSWTVGAIVTRVDPSLAALAVTTTTPVTVFGPVAINQSWTNWALQGSVQLGGGTLYGYVGSMYDARTYGLNYAYGLGGGATLHIGAERFDDMFGIPALSQTQGSVGVVFTF
jgi:hypothetical protein